MGNAAISDKPDGADFTVLCVGSDEIPYRPINPDLFCSSFEVVQYFDILEMCVVCFSRITINTNCTVFSINTLSLPCSLHATLQY